MRADARRLYPILLLLTISTAVHPKQVTFRDAFDSADPTWGVNSGRWDVLHGVYRADGTGSAYLADLGFADPRVEVDVRIVDFGAGEYNWAGVVIGGELSAGLRDGLMVYIRYSGAVDLFSRGRILASARTPARESFAAGRFVRLAVAVVGARVTVDVDGARCIDHELQDPPTGGVGLSAYDVQADFDNFALIGAALGNAITGRVLHLPGSTPAPGARVDIYHSMDGYDSPVTRSTVADERGRFTFTDLPAAERAYWLRASAEDHGGSTAWFVSVSDTKLTEAELHLVAPPPHDVVAHSDRVVFSPGFRQVADPQAFGGGRLEVRTELPAQVAPELLASCELEIDRAGWYTPHIAAGLYPVPHYWSDFWWGIDDGPLVSAGETLTIEGSRYGDRDTLTWAAAQPVSLSAGRHTLRLAVKDPTPHSPSTGPRLYAWTFDAAVLTRCAEPLAPADGATVATATPELSWTGSASADRYTVQYSSEPDFSNATVTLGGIRATETTPREPLADGTYYWRVKAVAAGDTGYGAGFSRTASLTVATQAPAIRGERVSCGASDRAFIRFDTDEPCTTRVLWGLSALSPTHSAVVSSAPATRHRLRLVGLSPMTYYYLWLEATDADGNTVRPLRRGFCTPRGVIAGGASPFGIFGQGMIYAEQMAQAGVGWYSDYWDWGALQPERGVFNWEQAEQRMARAAGAGVEAMVTFWGTPAWVRPSHPDVFTYGPDDLQDATDFFRAVAAHCAGRVEWWLPWIEPNVARDMVFGFPEGYWANRPHAPSYAAYEAAAYRGAKAGNPDCRVVGMNTAGIDLDFIRRCYDEGAADGFDVMNVHYYAVDAPFERQRPEKQFADLRALMSEYGDADKPILCSEGGGASSGLPGTDEASQADNIVRIFVISIANNIDKLCWTFELDEKPYGSKRVDMIMWMGLFRFDHGVGPDNPCGEPKPSYYAMKTMTGQLAGTEYVGPVAVGEGIRAYRFRAPDREVVVAWAEEGEAEVELPVETGPVTIVDREGNAAAARAADGVLPLRLTGSPVFVRAGG